MSEDTVQDQRLAGRRLLVTGASSGIGRSVVVAAAAAGARIALLARREAALRAIVATLPGDGHVVLPCDVGDPAEAAAAVAAGAELLGGLDAVVSSAGVVRAESVLKGDPAGWRAMLEVNVLGLLAVAQAAAPHLAAAAAAGGPADLVNVSSMSGRRRTSKELTVYAATKHAVHVISDGLREELTPLGVRTTILSPGFVATPIFATGEHDTAHSGSFDELANRVGIPPEVVAEAVVNALAQPVGTMLFEIAMLSTRQ